MTGISLANTTRRQTPWVKAAPALAAGIALTIATCLAMWNVPVSDDYHNGAMGRKGAITNTYDLYMNWSGRWFSMFVGSLPGAIGGIAWWVFGGAIVTLWTHHIAMSRLTGARMFNVIGLIGTVCLIAVLPGMGEHLYWFSGFVAYSLPAAGIAILWSLGRLGVIPTILQGLGMYALCCGSETTCALAGASAALWFILSPSGRDRRTYALLIAAALATVTMVGAPGIRVRMGLLKQQTGQESLPFSISNILYGPMVWWTTMGHPAVALGLAFLAPKLMPKVRATLFRFTIALLGGLVITCLVVLPSQLSHAPIIALRVTNMAVVAALIWGCFAAIMAMRLCSRQGIHPWIIPLALILLSPWTILTPLWAGVLALSMPRKRRHQWQLLPIALAGCLLSSDNARDLVHDILGPAQRRAQAHALWVETIQAAAKDTVVDLPFRPDENPPRSFHRHHPGPDPSGIANQWWALWFGVKGTRLSLDTEYRNFPSRD